jgi:serine/threonine-protein kinase
MLTKAGTKLLDFGLAKLKQDVAPATLLSELPTADDAITAEGTILGTLHYMAPEQVEGKEADARADIFAFGAVVYEMATGKQAFDGKSAASVRAAILEREPPAMSSLQPLTPPLFDHVVSQCLEKDPDQRWQTAGDVMRALKWIIQNGSQTSVPARGAKRQRLAWGVAAVATVVALAVAMMAYWRSAPAADGPAYRSSILLPSGVNLPAAVVPSGRFVLSPDGRRMAFIGTENQEAGLAQILAGGFTRLWVQSFDGLPAQPLAGTEGAVGPFWSPDSRFIGFRAVTKSRQLVWTADRP